MNATLRAALKALPFTLLAALCFWLMPHATEEHGRAPATWPGWGGLDPIATALVAILTTRTLREDDRRPAAEPGPKAEGQMLVLFGCAAATSAGLFLVGLYLWVFPSASLFSTRGSLMPFFAFDKFESQTLVTGWTFSFLMLSHRILAKMARDAARARAMREAEAAAAAEDAEIERRTG